MNWKCVMRTDGSKLGFEQLAKVARDVGYEYMSYKDYVYYVAGNCLAESTGINIAELV